MKISPKIAYFKPFFGLVRYHERNERIYGDDLPISTRIKTNLFRFYHSAAMSTLILSAGLALYVPFIKGLESLVDK